MLYGVTIGSTNTLTAYGFFLTQDVSFPMPEQKRSVVDVPAIDGSIDQSYLVSTDPVFKRRPLSFTLGTKPGSTFQTGLSSLVSLCHGKQTTLKVPWDSSYHYQGIFSVSGVDYVSQTVTVEVDAEPYMIANSGTGRKLA